MRQGRYLLIDGGHFRKRCRERGLNIDDVKNAIEHSVSCEPYVDRAPTNGGTNWRVRGPSIDDGPIAVGVEAFIGPDGEAVLLITLFEVKP